MEKAKLDNMVRGWFVGDFEPTLIKTQEVEVAVKEYRKGDRDELHYHKVATEITVIISGQVLINGLEYGEREIIIVEPFESADFEALEDTITTVVKYPGAVNDKYKGVVK